MALTTELIHATADQLHAQGINPTQANVRDALGGGSFSTIGQALKTWRAEKEIVAELTQVVVPQEIAERAELLINQVWDTAQTIANNRLVSEREALAVARTQMEADKSELDEVIVMLESENEQMSEQLAQLQAKIAELESDKTELQAQADDLTADNEKLTDKLTQAQSENQELKNNLDSLTAENKKLIKENSGLATENKHHIGDIDRLTLELEKTNQALEKQTEKHQAQSSDFDLVKKELATAHTENAKLQGRLEILTETKNKADITIENQAQKITELSALVAELKTLNKPKTDKKPTTNN